QLETGVAQATLGLLVQRNTAFAAGGRLPAPALGFDQLADAVATVADHLGRPAHCRGDDLVADHHDAQIEPLLEALQQHALIELTCAADGFLHVLGIAQVDGNAVTLLTVQDRKSTRLNSSHVKISYAVCCLKNK